MHIDHICEYHPDAVKPDTSTITDVAPATPECSPGMFLVGPVPAATVAVPVAQAITPLNLVAPVTTSNTPKETCRACTTAIADTVHWRCTNEDQHNTCCPSPIYKSQEAPIMVS